MASKSFSTSQIVNNSFVASTLGTAQFSDVFPGSDESSGTVFSFARVVYSWTGVTGGGAGSVLSVRGHVLSSNSPSVPAPGAAQVILNTRIGSAAVAYGTPSSSLGLAGIDPANGSEYCDVMAMAGAGTGAVCPLPKFWTLRLSNGSTAWTGGTLTIVSVTLFG